MNALAKILGPAALAATIIPPVLFMLKVIGEEPMKLVLLIATVAWFVAAPFWLKGAEE